jgi:tetratricopeptide (TPR) repeat protein
MRGRLFFQLGQPDSALSELTLAVDELRKRDAKDLVYVYQSKALFEHSIGLVYERLGDPAKAREAYGRALQEDLGYSPAHVRLGYMAIDSKDTAAALSEFDLAVQLRPQDSALRFQYGYLLGEAGNDADAEVQLRKALELNAWYAASHYALGRVHERRGKAVEAAQSFKNFLALASRNDLRRADALKRIETMASR